MTVDSASGARGARRAAVESGVVFATATAIAALYLRLTPDRFVSAIAPDGGDPMFVLYLLRWVSHQAAAGFPDFWQLNVFHPLDGALGLSDHLIGPGLLFGLLQAAGAAPAAAFNLLFFGSFGLAALCAFDVTRRLGYGRFAGSVVAFAFAFSHFRWHSLSQLHVLLAATFPWIVYVFDRLLVAPSARRGAAFLALYAFHLAGGVYLGYAQHLALLAIVVVRWPRLRGHLRDAAARRLLVAVAAASAALAAAAFLPYLHWREVHRVVTPVGWLSPLRTTVWSWFQVSLRSGPVAWLGHDHALVGRAAALSIGVAPAALLIVALIGGWRERRPAPPEPAARTMRLVAGLALLLAAVAVGDWVTHHVELENAIEARPWLRLYRRAGWAAFAGALLALTSLPAGARRFFARDDARPAFAATAILAQFAALPIGFFLLRNLLPGFGALRVTARLAILASPFLLLLVAEGAERLTRWSRPRAARLAGALVFVAMAVESQPLLRTIDWAPAVPEARFPPHVRWLAEEPSVRVILELPFDLNWEEAERMYHSSLHWKPMVNGYSSYIPAETLALLAPARALPAPDALATVAGRGVTHVVVHFDDYRGRGRTAQRKAWTQAARADGPTRVRVAYADPAVTVFALEPATNGGTADAAEPAEAP